MATITNTIRWADNTAELKKNLLEGVGTIDAMKQAVDRTTASLGGQGLFRAANNVTAAISELGGVTKMTAAEQARANDLLEKAIEKYKLMGMTAPPMMVELANATKKPNDEGSNLLSWLGKANNLLGLFGAGISVGAMIGFAKSLLSDADALVKMHDKTDISIEGLQRLQIAGDDAGNTLEQLTDAINKMQKKLAGEDTSAVAALNTLGLSFGDIRAMDPEHQFIAIGAAIAEVKDPAEQVKLAVDLFGKSGAEILPTLKRGFADLKDAAGIMSTETVRNLDTVGDAATRLWRSTKGAFANMLVEFFSMASPLDKGLKQLQDEMDAWDAQLNKAINTHPNITKEPLHAIGLPNDVEMIEINASLAAGLRVRQEHNKLAEEAAKATERWMANERDLILIEKGVAAIIDTIDGTVVDLVRDELAHGATMEMLAIRYNLTKVQVEGLNKQFANEKLALELAAEAARAHEDVLQDVGDVAAKVDGIVGALDVRLVNHGVFTLPLVVKQTKIVREATIDWGKELGNTALQMGQMGVASLASSGHLNNTTQTIIGMGTGLVGMGLASTAATTGVLGLAAGGTAATVAAGAMTLGIGAAAVGVALLIKHWWDHKKAVQEAQKDVANYEHQIWNTLTATQALEANGRQWAATTIAVRDAYLATGRSAAQAEIDVKALWDSSKLGAAATQAAIDKINQAFIEQKQDAADLKVAIDKYKFSIEDLGPAMQKQQLTEQAVTLMNDFRLLAGSGIDVNTVLEHMGGSINEFLNLALKTGMEVPIGMKPLLEKMIEMGTLTDANGVAITDLGATGVTFSETMTQGFDRIVAKFDELINKIAATTGAINAIPAKKTIDVGYTYDPFDPPGFVKGDDGYASRGGLVTNHGIQYMAGGGNVLPFLARGTDTVPAMLTPGERVLSVDQTRALNALSRGGGRSGGGQVVDMAEHNRAVRAAAEEQLKVARQALRMAERNAIEMPQMIGRAVRDAVQTSGRRR